MFLSIWYSILTWTLCTIMKHNMQAQCQNLRIINRNDECLLLIIDIIVLQEGILTFCKLYSCRIFPGHQLLYHWNSLTNSCTQPQYLFSLIPPFLMCTYVCTYIIYIILFEIWSALNASCQWMMATCTLSLTNNRNSRPPSRFTIPRILFPDLRHETIQLLWCLPDVWICCVRNSKAVMQTDYLANYERSYILTVTYNHNSLHTY